MDCLHIHDAEGHDTGFVCVPGPYRYQAGVHTRGARKWETVGDEADTIAEAFSAVGKALEADRRHRRYNRAGIWAVEQGESYYDPVQFYEVTVR
jgi:hypothetical protein